MAFTRREEMKNIVDILNGVVRPLVTFGFALTLQYGFITGKVSTDVYMGVAGMVIGFWFIQRNQSKNETPLAPPSNDKLKVNEIILKP